MIITPDTEENRQRAVAYQEFAGAVEVQSFHAIDADWSIALIFEIDGQRKTVRMDSQPRGLRHKTLEEFQARWKEQIINNLLAMKPHAAHLIELYGGD